MKSHRPVRASPPARDAVGHGTGTAPTHLGTAPTLGVVGVKNTPTSLEELCLWAKQCTRLHVRSATAFALVPYASGANSSGHANASYPRYGAC